MTHIDLSLSGNSSLKTTVGKLAADGLEARATGSSPEGAESSTVI
jgi:hypothetical protein